MASPRGPPLAGEGPELLLGAEYEVPDSQKGQSWAEESEGSLSKNSKKERSPKFLLPEFPCLKEES